jgi:phosphatidate cytidylyltransferase
VARLCSRAPRSGARFVRAPRTAVRALTDLPRRTITGLIYAAVLLAAAFAPPIVFTALVAVAAGIALVELWELRRAGLAAGIELVVLFIGIGALAYLRDLTAPPLGVWGASGPLLMTLFAVWAADVVAYLAGSAVGRRKIAPRISPGKTWEGTIAGFIAAGLVIVLWNRPFAGLPAWSVAAAILIGPVAFAGDLLESWMKRRAAVKDSGTILPGHGGMLDRIDSLVAAAPLVAAAILFLGRMG